MSKESDALEIYQELKFLGPQDSFGTFEKALVANLVPPWRRAVETERDLKAVQVDALVFELMGNALATTTAKVFLSRREFGYEVTNIVPNFGSLTRAAYNTVLSLFLETVARPAAVHAGRLRGPLSAQYGGLRPAACHVRCWRACAWPSPRRRRASAAAPSPSTTGRSSPSC